MMRTAVLIIAAVLSGLVAPVSMAQTRSLFDEFENLESTKALRKIEANGNAEDKSQTPAKPAVKSKPGAAASRTEPLPKTVAEPQLLEPPIVTPESAIESKPQPKTAPVAKAPRVVPRAATKAGTVPLLTSPASKPPVASSELDEHQSAVLSGDGFIDRIQRSDRRSVTSICADGCRGEIRGITQPKDPFAHLPDYGVADVPTGLAAQP